MKRILFIAADGLKKSGVPNVMLFIIKLLVNLGHSVDLIYFKKNSDDLLPLFQKMCRNIYFLGSEKSKLRTRLSRYFGFPQYRKKIKKIIKDNSGYDVIHSFAENNSYHFFKVAEKCGIKNFIVDNNCQLHNGGNFFDNLLMKKEKKYLSKKCVFKAPSLEVLKKSYGEKIHYQIIDNPFDYDTFFFDDKLNEPKSLTMCQIASFSSNKNQLFSLEVFRLLKKNDGNAKLLFLGFEHEPGYLEKIKFKIKELGISGVDFYDSNFDVKKIFDISSFLVLPSVKECSPLVLLEAQACGLRCYCSSNVPRESDKGNCVFLSLDNCSEWSKKILSDREQGLLKRKKCDFKNSNINYQIKMYKKLYKDINCII